jgi:hypothetical protein
MRKDAEGWQESFELTPVGLDVQKRFWILVEPWSVKIVRHTTTGFGAVYQCPSLDRK